MGGGLHVGELLLEDGFELSVVGLALGDAATEGLHELEGREGEDWNFFHLIMNLTAEWFLEKISAEVFEHWQRYCYK